MVNPYTIRCANVPDSKKFYVNKATGTDKPENGVDPSTPWKTLEYALQQLDTYGRGLRTVDYWIHIAEQTPGTPENQQLFSGKFSALHCGIDAGGAEITTAQGVESLLINVLVRNAVLCSDLMNNGGDLILNKCDIRAQQTAKDATLHLNNENEPNTFNISQDNTPAISYTDSEIYDTETIYNYHGTPGSETKPVNNANTMFVKADYMKGEWGTLDLTNKTNGVTNQSLAFGYYRSGAGAFSDTRVGQVAGFNSEGNDTPVNSNLGNLMALDHKNDSSHVWTGDWWLDSTIGGRMAKLTLKRYGSFVLPVSMDTAMGGDFNGKNIRVEGLPKSMRPIGADGGNVGIGHLQIICNGWGQCRHFTVYYEPSSNRIKVENIYCNGAVNS